MAGEESKEQQASEEPSEELSAEDLERAAGGTGSGIRYNRMGTFSGDMSS